MSPDGGSFATAQTVTISGIPSGDTCYYTTDGVSDPIYNQTLMALLTRKTAPVTFTPGLSTSASRKKSRAVNYSPTDGYSGVTVIYLFIAGSSLVQAPSHLTDGGSFASPQS